MTIQEGNSTRKEEESGNQSMPQQTDAGNDDVKAATVPPEQSIETQVAVPRLSSKWPVLVAAFLILAAVVVVVPVVLVKTLGDDESFYVQGTYYQDGDRYVVVNAPYNTSLHLFGPSAASVYSSNDIENDDSSLRSDLVNASWFLLNSVVKRNLNQQGYGAVGRGWRNPGFVFPMAEVKVDETADGSPTVARQGVGDDVSDFATNNQEDNVEEGDAIVADGNRVYAAYGNTLLVWDAATGESITTLELPPIEEIVLEAQSNEDYLLDLDPMSSDGGGPVIRSLVLYETRLLLIVEGYGRGFGRLRPGRDLPILHNYLGTQLRLYDTVSLSDSSPTLSLISSRHINGAFQAARVIDGKAHIVTSTGVDTYTDLVGPSEIWNDEYRGVSKRAYVNTVHRQAEKQRIATFVNGLVDELGGNGVFPKVARLGLLQSTTSGSQLEEILFGNGVLNSFSQVTSFDMASDESDMAISSTGVFLPSSWAEVYAANDALILAGQGWDYSPQDGNSFQSTYLVGMALEGASSMPQSIGQVPGYVLNSHSIDVLNGTLRVASTVENWWSPFVGRPSEPESRTRNYITMLELADSTSVEPAVMKELGRLQLGKPNEIFTAVRFFDNIAYAVTFERIDPLYVLDLSDPRNPEILSELEITGFSQYLHSINEDNTLILAIGQEADSSGTILGLAITVFDVTTPSEPFVAQRYVVEQDLDTYSHSDSLWDFKATRVAADRLFLPLDIYSSSQDDSFAGLVVFRVSADEIAEECRVATTSSTATDYGWCASLPRRSMIFQGNLMTTHGDSVQSTDLGTCRPLWNFEVALESESSCYYY